MTSPFLQGSFRGAAFLFDASQYAPGRRVADHEFPTPGLPDKPGYPEDLGIKTDQFTLTVFVMESAPGAADWGVPRDALIAAIKAAGPGTLIHPIWGRMTAQVIGPAQVTEAAKEIGIVYFTIPFILAAPFALAPATAPTAVTTATAAAEAALPGGFAAQFSIAEAPPFAVVGTLADLGDALAQIGTIVGTLGAPAAALAAWQAQSAALAADAETLMATPSSYGTSIVALVTGISMLDAPLDSNGNPTISGWAQQLSYPSIGMSADQVSATQQTLLSIAAVAPRLAAGAGAQRQANRAALFQLIQAAALLEGAGATAAMSFDSRSDALAAREQIGAAMAAQTLALADLFEDRPARLFDAARRKLIVQLNQAALRLPVIADIVLPSDMPAILLSHLLYDDPSFSGDIVGRNDLDDPLFVPGGVALEVLAP